MGGGVLAQESKSQTVFRVRTKRSTFIQKQAKQNQNTKKKASKTVAIPIPIPIQPNQVIPHTAIDSVETLGKGEMNSSKRYGNELVDNSKRYKQFSKLNFLLDALRHVDKDYSSYSLHGSSSQFSQPQPSVPLHALTLLQPPMHPNTSPQILEQVNQSSPNYLNLFYAHSDLSQK